MFFLLATAFLITLAAGQTPPQPLFAYNDTLTRTEFFPLAAAAYSKQPQACFQKYIPDVSLYRRVETKCDKLITDKCSGFIATRANTIIISFRGTNSNGQLELEMSETLATVPDDWVGGGKVDEYFDTAFFYLWNGGIKDGFLGAKSISSPNAQLWITGHSLGGALASLAASYIAQNNLFPSQQIYLVTFGQPRTGDKNYAKYHDQMIGTSYRVVHAQDPVPHVPGTDFYDYYHHMAEVWYPAEDMSIGAKYNICLDSEESVNCSDGNGAANQTNWNDHMHYFNQQVMKFCDQ